VQLKKTATVAISMAGEKSLLNIKSAQKEDPEAIAIN
jgi:hypothetical protein